MDITDILSAVVALISALLTTLLIPWLRGRLGDDAVSRAHQWISIAVQAAEQIYAGPGRGAEKKRYVLELLADRGVKIDEKALEAVLEAEVLKLGEEVRL